MNLRNDKLIKWLTTAVFAMSTAWAGWVSTSINDLHSKQSTLQAAVAEINGKLDVIIEWTHRYGK